MCSPIFSKHLSPTLPILFQWLQFLCSAVFIELEATQQQPSSIKPNAIFDALGTLPTDSYKPLQFTTISEVVFSLAQLWEVGADEVRMRWAANFFAVGLGDKGKEVRREDSFTD